MIRKLPIFSTIVVAAAIAVMIALGFWQLGRLEEKEALIARYAAAQAQEGISAIYPDRPEAAYTRTMIYCTDPEEVRSVAGRSASGEAGWAQMVRCTFGGPWPDTAPEDMMPDYVLQPIDVVLGWSRSPQAVEWQGGQVTGTVVPTGELGYKLVADPPLAGLGANAKPDPKDLPNNHLAYAGQWFFFALVAGVIYVLALRKRLRDNAG
ncbi:MAG: SURF1 family protein [Sphingomonadaceae bacterium]